MRYELRMKEQWPIFPYRVEHCLYGVENINIVLHNIQCAKYREKRQIIVFIPSDCKIADSYLIGYSHVLLRRHESGRFDVLYSVGISLIFKNIFHTC